MWHMIDLLVKSKWFGYLCSFTAPGLIETVGCRSMHNSRERVLIDNRERNNDKIMTSDRNCSTQQNLSNLGVFANDAIQNRIGHLERQNPLRIRSVRSTKPVAINFEIQKNRIIHAYPLLHENILGMMYGSTHGRIGMVPQIAFRWRDVFFHFGTGQHQRRGAIRLERDENGDV